MPKKYIFYSIIALLLVVIGIYGFTKWTEAREKVNLWTLVPDDAVFIVESTNHARLLEGLEKIDLWDNIARLQSVEAFSENILLLDSVSGRKEGASRFLRRKTLLTSVHVVNRNKFDYVFYIPINTVGEHRFIRSLVENIGKSKRFTAKTYKYQDQLITQINNQHNGDTFSYFSFHNNIIVSVNPELIREIVRKISRGQLESPAAEYASINYLSQPEVFAQVFVNYRHLPQFLHIFLQDKVMPDVRYFASLGRTSMLGFKQQQGEFLINGFSNPEPLSDSFFNRIKAQAPQPFELRNYLPVRTALLVHLGLDQVAAARHWYPQEKKLEWPATQVAWADSLGRSFRHELGIAYLETNQHNGDSEKIIFARSPDPARTQQLLTSLIGQAEAGGAAAAGRQGPYAWKQIPVKELPLLLFGSPARGFETCFVSQVDSFTVFAPDLGALRSVLADIRAGRVWAQAGSQQALLEHTQQESNFSLYLNTPLAWKMLVRQLRPGQRPALLRHETLVKKLSQMALQYGRQQDQYYTSLLLTYPQAGSVSQQPQETFEVQQQVTLPDELISPPWVVQPPGGTGSGGDLLVQDEEYRLHRLQANGEVAWTDSIDQVITSPVYPVIFGQGKQNKYLFAAGSSIYCLDQSGRPAPNFPFHLPDTVEITQLAVLRFNHSQEPRLLIGDQTGNLFMFDMAGNLQEGWGPKSLEVPLAATPQLYRVNGRDVLLVMLQNGYIYAFNTQGELYGGFPLQVEARLQYPAFGAAGNSLRQTRLTVLSPDGLRVSFDLTGQVLAQEQLPASRAGARFELVAEPGGKSYIISRQQRGQVSLYDQNLKLLLEKNFITSSRKISQYFDFGPLNRVYVLTETGPAKTYLYNYQAKLIGREPIDNKLPVTIQFNPRTQRYAVYHVMGKTVKRIVFRDK